MTNRTDGKHLIYPLRTNEETDREINEILSNHGVVLSEEYDGQTAAKQLFDGEAGTYSDWKCHGCKPNTLT